MRNPKQPRCRTRIQQNQTMPLCAVRRLNILRSPSCPPRPPPSKKRIRMHRVAIQLRQSGKACPRTARAVMVQGKPLSPQDSQHSEQIRPEKSARGHLSNKAVGATSPTLLRSAAYPAHAMPRSSVHRRPAHAVHFSMHRCTTSGSAAQRAERRRCISAAVSVARCHMRRGRTVASTVQACSAGLAEPRLATRRLDDSGLTQAVTHGRVPQSRCHHFTA